MIKVRVAGLTHNVVELFVRPQDTFRDLLKQLLLLELGKESLILMRIQAHSKVNFHV